MRKLIDAETGEVFDNVKYIRTAESDKAYEKLQSKKLNRSNENFIFLTYDICNKLNIDNGDFKQSDIAKIIYIMSYVGNDNKLMLTERTPITKDKLSELLGLNKKIFNTFYNKLINNNILIEKDNCLFIDKQFSFYGSIKNNKYNIIRIYKKNIRKLYNSVSTKQHKQLAILYLLIPFINIKYNIICSNPFEEDENKLIPMKVEELAKYFNYNLQSFISLIDFLSDLKDKDNMPIIKTINNTKNKKDNSIVVNPRVIYAGDDFRNVKAFSAIFNI